jgi:NarL family two-component system response regulator LiaR
MKKKTMIYGLALALGAFALQWLENQYAVRLFSTEIYIVLIAAFFTGIGIWVGTRSKHRPQPGSFERNERVIRTLGLTGKEMNVLELLAEGGSNHDIAKRLFVSTSTVKSHLVSLYRKLDVSRRTQAVQKARTLQIIQ